MPEIRTKPVEKMKFKIYLEKAGEFYRLMQIAEEEGLCMGVGLNSVHCAISVCDALTTFYLGHRSASQKHYDAVVLLGKIQDTEIKNKTAQLNMILSVKNQVEYEAREFRKKDAEKIIKQTERLYEWAITKLPSQTKKQL